MYRSVFPFVAFTKCKLGFFWGKRFLILGFHPTHEIKVCRKIILKDSYNIFVFHRDLQMFNSWLNIEFSGGGSTLTTGSSFSPSWRDHHFTILFSILQKIPLKAFHKVFATGSQEYPKLGIQRLGSTIFFNLNLFDWLFSYHLNNMIEFHKILYWYLQNHLSYEKHQ